MGSGERSDQTGRTRISTLALYAQEKSQSGLLREGWLDLRGRERKEGELEVQLPQEEEARLRGRLSEARLGGLARHLTCEYKKRLTVSSKFKIIFLSPTEPGKQARPYA